MARAERRDDVADLRDRTAQERDRAADARDKAADARDKASVERERNAIKAGSVEAAVAPLREIRSAGASARRASAGERAAAAADRDAAAADRKRASNDRRYAGIDELTRVYRRGAGELALTKEIARSRRAGTGLVFAVIDVDGLKIVNDRDGHAAGDALLREVASSITSTMRAYDVTVRWGGDEFVCALCDTSLQVASERIAEIRGALAQRKSPASISAGFAGYRDGDTLESLVDRADADLYRRRGRPRRRR
jgi:diguanylate cyclase (GGDEF)-like protein